MAQTQQEKIKETVQGVIVLIIIGFGIYIWASWPDKDGNETKTEVQKQEVAVVEPEEKSPASTEWYEGGNLHGKKIQDWREATSKNRLATAADFISKITGELNKEKSIELEACLTTFASGADNKTEGQKVAEIGTLCAIQLGYVRQ